MPTNDIQKVAATIQSDTAASRAAAISAQVHDAASDDISAAIAPDEDVASKVESSSSQLREFMRDELHDAVLDMVSAAIPSITAASIASGIGAQVSQAGQGAVSAAIPSDAAASMAAAVSARVPDAVHESLTAKSGG